MSYTKEEVIEKINKSFSELKDKTSGSDILINRLIENAGLKSEEKFEILELFGVNKYADLIQTLDQYEVYIPHGKKDKAVKKRQSEEQMCNTITKENKMPETTKHHDRISALKNALSEGLYEKDEALRLALLAAIAGESIFFLGAPGCAKSMLARRIAKAFKTDGDGSVQYFETLLNQFSTPEDVFGNISLKGLNGEGESGKEEYRRLTENMLPEADVAFIDEIWKASPAILNTLLSIVNEHIFHNGSEMQKVPLKALLAASNELPAKNRGLEALYDRFILRLPIGFIQNEDSFFDMVNESSSLNFELSEEIKKLQISNEELNDWKNQIDSVYLSEAARAVISAIRKELTVQNEALSEEDKNNGELFEVGDRRWKKIVRILKTSAFLNERTEVDLMDCQLIEYCIWGTERQQEKAREIVEKCIKQNGLDCDTAIEEINEQIDTFKTQVDETWFEEVKEPATDKIVIVDGQECYECIRNGTKETWYVTIQKGIHGYYDYERDFYDSNKNYYTHSNFQKNGDTISCWGNFTVKKNPAQTHSEQKAYSDIAQETLQKNFDASYYAPIVDNIQSEIEALKNKKEQDAEPFKANLFANQEYNTILTSKLDEAIHALEDAKINLDKQHERYFNSELKAEYSVGDIILKNGIVLSSEELKSITEEQKNNVVAVVCITGEQVFAMGITEKKMLWNSINDFASNYGENLPKEYSIGWIVPDKETLYSIWENRAVINKSLETIGIKNAVLGAYEYWSSSSNGDSAAFYQLFDENGSQDHTTKDHVYAVRTIREWNKI
jgi:hypothetical protein